MIEDSDMSILVNDPPLLQVGRVANWWSALTLVRQFMLLSSILVLAGLGILGYWVSSKIEQGIKLDVATRAALYMQNFLSPHLQELAKIPELSKDSVEKIEAALSRDAKSLSVKEAKVWNLQGKVLFGTDKSLLDRVFPVTDELSGAANGRIEIDFDNEPHMDHDHPGAQITETLFEIYVPIRDSGSGKVIAIAEFYQDATIVKNAIVWARLESWGVTGLVSLGLIAGLYNVVARGSKLIEQQRRALDNRITDLTALLKQNEELRKTVDAASQRSNEDLEIQFRRIGSDLHDGIGQILTIVMLRLDRVFSGKIRKNKEYEAVRAMLNDAMTEIRDMSVGLALPEIEKLPLEEAIWLIVSRHERRTSTKVELDLQEGPVEPSHPVKLCLCRFVQEGLNNSFKHAGGISQKVTSRWNGAIIALEVVDRGPGLDATRQSSKRQSLGLVGLQNRLESLGGKLAIKSGEGQGTILTATLKVYA